MLEEAGSAQAKIFFDFFASTKSIKIALCAILIDFVRIYQNSIYAISLFYFSAKKWDLSQLSYIKPLRTKPKI